MTTRNVELSTSDGTKLRGKLFLPASTSPKKTPLIITMTGWTFLAAHTWPICTLYAQAGVAALAIDYRTYGLSDGEPRHSGTFSQDVIDFSDVVTFATTIPEIDHNRIGIWSIGHGASRAVHVVSIDPRLKTLVLHMPALSGTIDASRWPEDLAERVLQSRIEAVMTGKPRMAAEPQFDDPAKPDEHRVLGGSDLWQLYKASKENVTDPNGIPWELSVTHSAIESERAFEGWPLLPNIQIPLLWIAAEYDEVTDFSWQQEQFAKIAARDKEMKSWATKNVASFFDQGLINETFQHAVDWNVTRL